MMSFTGELRHTPADTKSPGTTTSMDGSDPLQNLSAVQARVDTLQKFLHNSVNSNTLIGKDQMAMVSGEIATAIHQIIINGAALLASTQTQNNPESILQKSQTTSQNSPNCETTMEKFENPKLEEVRNSEDYEIIEMDAVELLAEHIHFCEICGKGFKRDANLRMHMRAHGDQFKTLEALTKPEAEKHIDIKGRRTRFSCPFVGCNRNKQHKKFRPLKSVICVKNHFKRSHCPKMYSCTRCNKKNFSVLADLKSHLKHCGEVKWRCSCGTNFSRKDKLFGHMALFEGHMPAVMESEVEAAEGRGVGTAVVDDEDVEMGESSANFEGLLDGFECIENYGFQDIFSSSSNGNDFFSF